MKWANIITAFLLILLTAACYLPAIVIETLRFSSVIPSSEKPAFLQIILWIGFGFTILAWLFLLSTKAKNKKETPSLFPLLRTNLFTLFGFTAFLIAIFSFNSSDYQFSPPSSDSVPAITENPKESTIPVDGMTCQSCEHSVQETVLAIPGVISAEASAPDKQLQISFDPQKVQIQNIVDTINAQTHYKASLPLETQSP